MRTIFALLLSFISTSSFSQGMYGFGFGLGYTTSYHSRITAAVEGYHLWRITPHLYAGGVLSVQRYSFTYDTKQDPFTISYGDDISIQQKTSYLFFSPKIDVGIGYRKRIHINLSGGAGVVMGAGQWATEYAPLLVTAAGNVGADTVVVNTSYNVTKVIYRVGFGISERIPTHGYFNIILSQEFSYLMNKLNKGGPNLVTNYVSFTVGLVHKYPQVWKEVD